MSAFHFFMESTLYVFVPTTVCLPCNHGLDFDVSLCDNLINQSIESGHRECVLLRKFH